ncbi:hypothetical protein [Marinomonas algicola]|uniref:hypothetical protein n=1 Tax=Marinomonas algicola TaxID=2773454 RepID=UPI001748B12E|nr:hypothetical protein [Marinomonas algicola]
MIDQKETQDISNCISADFDKMDQQAAGNWSICYSTQKNSLTLSVNVVHPLASNGGTELTTEIDEKGLNDMLAFLHQVKYSMGKPRL